MVLGLYYLKLIVECAGIIVTVMKPKKGYWKVNVEGVRVVNNRQSYALVTTGSIRSISTSAAALKGSANWINCHFLCLSMGAFFPLNFLFALK